MGKHVCFSRKKNNNARNAPRDQWRDDRAKPTPRIGVALTHPTSVLKYNKEEGNWCYLIAMLADEGSGLSRNYYQVVVEPRKGGSEAVFKTAYDDLTIHQWVRPKSTGRFLPPMVGRGRERQAFPAADDRVARHVDVELTDGSWTGKVSWVCSSVAGRTGLVEKSSVAAATAPDENVRPASAQPSALNNVLRPMAELL